MNDQGLVGSGSASESLRTAATPETVRVGGLRDDASDQSGGWSYLDGEATTTRRPWTDRMGGNRCKARLSLICHTVNQIVNRRHCTRTHADNTALSSTKKSGLWVRRSLRKVYIKHHNTEDFAIGCISDIANRFPTAREPAICAPCQSERRAACAAWPFPQSCMARPGRRSARKR
jgi:hypothetical protein